VGVWLASRAGGCEASLSLPFASGAASYPGANRGTREVALSSPHNTTAAKRFRKVEHATALLWKVLQIAKSRFRRLQGASCYLPGMLGRGILIARSGERAHLRGLPPDCEGAGVFLALERLKE
jgi:hypothetical protein